MSASSSLSGASASPSADEPIRSRVCPDINPLNGGIVDSTQAGMTCPGSSDASPSASSASSASASKRTPSPPAAPGTRKRLSFQQFRSLLSRRSSQ